MYESPISIIETVNNNVSKRIDDELFMYITKEIGFDIDKEELIKALEYDRDQYNKGFNDGKRECIVTCSECKYAPSGTDEDDDRGFGLKWPHDDYPEDNPCPCKCSGDRWYSHKPSPNFFCAYGKREES